MAFALVAVAWLVPPQWGLALVYLHPLMAFWLLDRELGKELRVQNDLERLHRPRL